MYREILKFWAKTSKNSAEPDAFHPLMCHLIDVAVVAREMWKNVLPNATKERIARAFGETEFDDEISDKIGNLIAFIAGLHDLGKCSPPFALRGLGENGQTKRLLSLYKTTSFDMPAVNQTKDAPHGYVTAVELPTILSSEKFNFNHQISKQISTMIGGHHGVFPSSGKLLKIEDAKEKSVGNEHWKKARIELVETLTELLKIEPLEQNENKKLDNAAIMILAGLVSVADWIGSDEEYFQCAVEDSFAGQINLKQGSLDSYLEHAEKQAVKALQKLGWIARKKENSGKFDKNQSPDKKFEKLFPFIENRRHLQDMAIEISRELKAPGIAVIEAPTGEGKTEAAMFLADAWNTFLNQNGYYFALPTQATSNQMFGRAEDFLKKRFPDRDVHLQLLHGHASLSAEFETLKEEFRKIRDVFDDLCEGNECVPSVVAAEWFTYRKRGLLAPFGVGTVDQALMAVLQTKHVFVRLFGLAHKTVIIDEVHAYDAYMSTLLERLLEWLAALASPVILLSATLPRERRNKLIRAYQRGLAAETRASTSVLDAANEKESAHDKYPRISYTTDSVIKVRHIETSEKSRTLFVEKVDDYNEETDENFVKKLKAKLKENSSGKPRGCIAIICNTVQRSQEVFEALSNDEFFRGEASDGLPKLDLLHARFRFIDREKREERVLKRFGKPDKNDESPNRPECAVLVATQIIEQSLDLDFDLVISDLAPIDLLLQRAGRVHRHERERPKEFKEPTLWLIEPEKTAERLPNFKNSSVYDDHILLRTGLVLNEIEQIKIPEEVEDLIEAVYGKTLECPNALFQKFWNDSKTDLQNKLREKRIKAKGCRITDADDEDLFENQILELDEDKPEIHKTLQALTRDDEMPSVSVVILTAEEAEKINLKEKPKQNEIEFLLKRECKITKVGLTNLILDAENLKPKSWKNSALLRHHRLLQLDENNKLEIGNFIVSLDENLGIVIGKGERNGK